MHGFLSRSQRSKVVPYVLIAPAFAVVFVLAAFSAFWLIRMSLVQWTFGADWTEASWVGAKNYEWLLFNEHSTFRGSAAVTAVYVASTLIPELFIGFGLALLLNRQIFGRSIYTAVLIIPIVVMPSMVGLVWRLYFSYDGLVNFFVETFFGVKPNWYGAELALPAVILVDIWEWTPFFVLILLAGLQALPREPYDAALVDGASNWQLFRHITLPLMAPLLLTATILRFMDILRIFDVIYAMFAGGPGDATTTLPLYIYRVTLLARNVGRGSAVSVMLIITIVALTFILVRLLERIKFEM